MDPFGLILLVALFTLNEGDIFEKIRGNDSVNKWLDKHSTIDTYWELIFVFLTILVLGILLFSSVCVQEKIRGY